MLKNKLLRRMTILTKWTQLNMNLMIILDQLQRNKKDSLKDQDQETVQAQASKSTAGAESVTEKPEASKKSSSTKTESLLIEISYKLSRQDTAIKKLHGIQTFHLQLRLKYLVTCLLIMIRY